MRANDAARLMGKFHDALVARFIAAGKSRDEAVAIINANKPLFLAEIQKAGSTVH